MGIKRFSGVKMKSEIKSLLVRNTKLMVSLINDRNPEYYDSRIEDIDDILADLRQALAAIK